MKFSSFSYLIKEGIKNVWVNRMMSFASVSVLLSCLLLTGTALLFSRNITNVMQRLQSENVINVYLKQEATKEQAESLGKQLLANSNVQSVEFISKEQALSQYVDVLGPLFEGLKEEENFLPDCYKVTMKDLSIYPQTISQIRSMTYVDEVNDKSDAASKLSRLNKLVSTAGFWIIIILSFVSIFIISNTIKMTMYSRKLEISIMKSVGATNMFIRLPFIVEGIIIGLIAAFLASISLRFLYDASMNVIRQVINFNYIPFANMAGSIFGGFAIMGILFGLISGVVSIRKYLRVGEDFFV